MIRFFRFSPSRLALAYVALSVLVLALFAIPLWYGWRVNISTFRAYVQGEDLQRLVEVFHSGGAKALVAAMESQSRSLPGDQIMVLADASKVRLAGNLPAWPGEVPDAPGTYGLVISLGGGSTMRVVASHVRLPGGYHLLMGRESVRFESLVERFWYGIAGATGIVLLLGAVIAWLIRRALLAEVQEISRTASAIVEGDLSRRIATRGRADELGTLAGTVNGMLEQLARQNVQLEGEIAVRRQAEHALHRAHDDLEGLVAQRTAQLARVNESLRRSEAYLAEAQRLSHTGSWAFNVATRQIVHWSQEHFRIFGFDPEQGMPSFETLLQRIHPDDRARAAEVLERAIRERTDYELDWRIVPSDGTMKYLHAEGHPAFNSSGDLVESVGTVMDVTERKRAERRLMAQYTVTQILAEAATFVEVTPKILQTVCEFLLWDLGALWSLDREAGLLRCVEVWHKESVEDSQFEAASRESTFTPGIGLPGRVWSSHEPAYIPDVVHDANFPRAAIAAREGLHAAFAFPILLGGEVLGVIEFFSHEIRQPDQELLNMMATLGSQMGQFIERKRAEDALHHAQAELAHVTRVATLGEMTASIAHEINQPLTAVIANANASLRWLAAANPNLDEARDAVSRIVRDGNRAGEVIARIRALVQKADTGKVRLDINQTVQEVVILMQNEAVRKGVVLQMDLAADVPPVFGDRIQLQQVILNLVMNGIEAMDTVTDRPREMLIRSSQHESDQLLVAVQDSGIGIDGQNLGKIFDAFYTTKPQGMGMGLAISRSIVENHGGRLWAVPNDGPGATFQFTLDVGGQKLRPSDD
jgi:PAS domain S-box-containing protein